MGERVSISTDRYQLLQEPGLRPPSLRLTYASSAFQRHVVACFDGRLPWIRFNEDGLPFFEYRDEGGRETCILAEKVASIADIPRSESLRLLEGLLRLQTLAVGGSLGEAEAGMVAAFLLPDPATDLRNFRLYDPLPPATGKRLHILWGFSTRTNPRSAIPADMAIARLLDVPPEELVHVAETECDPEIFRKWLAGHENEIV